METVLRSRSNTVTIGRSAQERLDVALVGPDAALIPAHADLANSVNIVFEPRKAAVSWLERAINAQLQQFPKSKSWLLPLTKMIDYTPPLDSVPQS